MVLLITREKQNVKPKTNLFEKSKVYIPIISFKEYMNQINQSLDFNVSGAVTHGMLKLILYYKDMVARVVLNQVQVSWSNTYTIV